MHFSDHAFDDFGADAPAAPPPDVTTPRAGTMEPVVVDPRLKVVVQLASTDARRMLVPAQSIVLENHNDGFINRAMRIGAGGLVLEKGDWVPAPGMNHQSVPPFNFAGLIYLILQDDGNLVLYKLKSATGAKEPLWATGARGDRAIFQTDGNFVLYNGSTPVWSSRTYQGGENGSGRWLGLQSDGNICVYGDVQNAANYPYGEPRWCGTFGHGHTPGFWDDVLTVLKDVGIVVGTVFSVGIGTALIAGAGAVIYQGASGGNVLNVNETIQKMPAITAAPITLTADAITGGSAFQWTLEHPLETVGIESAATALAAAAIYGGIALAPAAGAGVGGGGAAAGGAAAGGISAGTVGTVAGAVGAGATAVGTVARIAGGGGGSTVGSTQPTTPTTTPAGQQPQEAGIFGNSGTMLLWGAAGLLALLLFSGKRR